jgi:phosphatidylserine decarboxylase
MSPIEKSSNESGNNFFKNSAWQYFMPQRFLSRLAGLLANCDYEPIKNLLIEKFIKHYQVSLEDACIENPREFENFNHFFTRALKADARPFDTDSATLISPADGALSEFGKIENDQLLQAKGQNYSLAQLLANNQEWIEAFSGGSYSTIYLAPKDYHRVHMPLAGELLQMIHVPGKLFSVNQKTTQEIPGVFARNERVICIFQTAVGPMALILVGAIIVASIATTWHGQVTPFEQKVQSWHYQKPTSIHLEKAAEMGRFYLGSTAIVLLPRDAVEWNPDLMVGQSLQMGQSLGKLITL